MATVRRHGKKWQGIVRRKGCKSSVKSFAKKSDVLRWVRSEEATMDVLQNDDDQSILDELLLGDLMVRYRDTVSPTKKSHCHERNRINLMLRHPITQLKLSELNSGYFARYRDDRLRTTGPQSVRHELNTFSIVIRTAKIDWSIPINRVWLDDIRKPKIPAARDRRLMGDEYERLMEAAHGSQSIHMSNIIEFAIQTGMRVGEIASLEWSNISLHQRIAHLPDTKNGSSRDVPLSTMAVQVLSQQHGYDNDQPFPITKHGIGAAFRKICKQAGIKNLRFHDLRHEAISRLFEHGLLIPEVALISGHKDFRMLARYTHLKAHNIVHKLG